MADETWSTACGRCGRAMSAPLPVCPKCMARDPKADEPAALRARAERAESECARMTAEYQAWIEELEGPTPAELRARAERYREALEPFARYAEKMRPGPLPDTACVAVHRDNVNGDTEITIADLKRAQKALAATGDEEGKGGEGR